MQIESWDLKNNSGDICGFAATTEVQSMEPLKLSPAEISLAARQLLKELIKEKMPDFNGSLEKIPNDQDGVPIFPPGLVASISHTESRLFVVCGWSHLIDRIGCDVENIITDKIWHDIQTLCFTPHEQQIITHTASVDKLTLATSLFSAKESIYKCHFPRQRKFFDYDAYELCDGRYNDSVLVFQKTPAYHGDEWTALPGKSIVSILSKDTYVMTWTIQYL